MDIGMHIYTFAALFAGAIVQSTAGFSGGTMSGLVLSLRMSVLSAGAVTSPAMFVTCFRLGMKYKEHIRPRLILPVIPLYIACMFCALQCAKTVDTVTLKAYFGLFLVVLALYSRFLSKRIRISRSCLARFLCAGVSGTLNGFFGVGGPLMALYFLNYFEDDKEGFVGNIQTLFAINCILTTIIRLTGGVLPPNMLSLLIPAIAGSFLGQIVGARILDRLNLEGMRTVMFWVLIISGMWTFIANI